VVCLSRDLPAPARNCVFGRRLAALDPREPQRNRTAAYLWSMLEIGCLSQESSSYVERVRHTTS
jgi:hypothetical protein